MKPDNDREIFKQFNLPPIPYPPKFERSTTPPIQRQSAKEKWAEAKRLRIFSSTQDKYEHALEVILENASMFDTNVIRIDSFHFNFHDRTDEQELFKQFLNKLIKERIILCWREHSSMIKRVYAFHYVDKAKLEAKIRKSESNNNKTTTINGLDTSKLTFFPETSTLYYLENRVDLRVGTKRHAFIRLLHENPHTPFSVDNIKEYCNQNIRIKKYYFKSERDIDDTLREIRKSLNVKNKSYFPILKETKGSKKTWVFINK